MITKDILRQIKTRNKNATQGKWRWADYNCKHGQLEDKETLTVLEAHEAPRIPIIRKKNQKYSCILEIDDSLIRQEDKDFIAHSKSDIELLINSVDFFQKEIGILKKTLEFYATGYDNGSKARTALREDEVSTC